MNWNLTYSAPRPRFWALVFLALPLAPGLCPTAQAFPAAPYHLIYGLVRDRYGTPLTSDQAQIILETPQGVQLAATVIPGLGPGVNYQIKVPMDAGETPERYQPNALIAAAPFKMVVVIGTVTNVPIEMSGNYSALGQSAENTRVDLTLGVDANGDGIPDDWELAFLAARGLNVPLSSLNASSILTPDGLTLQQEYLQQGEPLTVAFLGFNGASPVLRFPTLTGRSYTVLASPDAVTWNAVAFNLASEALGSPTRTYYVAPGIAAIQVYVVPPPSETASQFYRIQVQ